MSFWKTAGWIAAGVGAVVAAPVTGGGSIAAVLGAAGTTTAAGVAVGAAAGLAGSALTDDTAEKAHAKGKAEGKAENALEMAKLREAFKDTQAHYAEVEEQVAYLEAMITVGMACAWCDGELDPLEKKQIQMFAAGMSQHKFPTETKASIEKIINSKPSLNTALAKAEPFMQTSEEKKAFTNMVKLTMKADGDVNEREKRFIASWERAVA